MDIILYGISWKTASVDVREQFSFSNDEVREYLSLLIKEEGVEECLVLSTCNRTEVYAVCRRDSDASKVVSLFHRFKKTEMPLNDNQFYFVRGIGCVRHLFRVSAGLESQVLGENQIQGQVKDAYSLACGAKTNGLYLNKLFHSAFRVGKSVRNETRLGNGAVSIVSVIVELLGQLEGRLSDKSVLLIGAGLTARLTVRRLYDRGIRRFKIANRTRCKAELLAAEYGAEVIGFERIKSEFLSNDIVVSTTSSPGYIITEEAIRPFALEKRHKDIIVIDIAIPRDIDPRIARHENIRLYDMDDLKTVMEKNINERRSEIPRAEEIVEKGVVEFSRWLNERESHPLEFRSDGPVAKGIIPVCYSRESGNQVHLNELPSLPNVYYQQG